MSVNPPHIDRIDRLDLRERRVAEQVLDLLREAHADEARWASTPDELPFGHTLEDLMAEHADGREVFHGAWVGGGPGATLVGCASVAPASADPGEADQPGPLGIGNLAVRATHRRQGVARSLLAWLIDGAPGRALVVVTGLDNGPALALYAGLGFVPVRCGALGPQAVPVVQLLRAADAGPARVIPAPTIPT